MDVTFERECRKESLGLFGTIVSEGKDEWLTPPEIVKALGPFDLDPCSPINRPWPTAAEHFTVADDGLRKPWHGRVWCNPPYGNQTALWLKRCSQHGNAIALTFARTETKMFFESVWNGAEALFFFRGRLHFYHVTGKPGGSAGAGSVLIAYGEENADRLLSAGLNGVGIRLRQKSTGAVHEGVVQSGAVVA